MAGLFSSLQTLSGKLVDAIRGSGGQKPNKNKSIEEDLKWLRRMLQRIEAVQQDAEDREIHDKTVALWLRELRGVAHEAEDVLDEFHYEVLKSIVENRNTVTETSVENNDDMMTTSSIGSKRKLDEIFTSSSHASSSGVFKILASGDMADEIKRIRNRFEEISKDHEHLRLMADDGLRRISAPQCRPPTSYHIDEKGLFGRENEKKEIINLLNIENTDFTVLPIVGKGGLGKTTIAQLVYNDSDVRELFDKRAWVSVSEDFDIVRLTKAILESISGSPCLFSELSKIRDILMEKLNGTKLFLVMDDIWNEEKTLWESFRIVFNRAKTVKILITTRSLSIAKVMQTVSPFELAQLHEDNCWMLFKHCVFGNQEENEHTNLLKIGRNIVKKCDGLPLAVKVLGGLLGYETSEEKWKEIEEINTWEAKEILTTLRLSYHHMPLHLRPCFLYLPMFPKDTEFRKEHVIRLWMAQGYINSRPNKTVEDIGREYFEELQCRSLIDFVHQGTYVLHDLIHDLARSINETIHPTSRNDNQWDDSFHVYHLYLNKQNDQLNYITTNNVKSIRTLWNYTSDDISADSSPNIFSSVVSLRSLQLDAYMLNLVDDIGMLKHLRYLAITGDGSVILPKELCVLYNLQIFELRLDSLDDNIVLELPSDIGNLINLRCLMINVKMEQLPDSIRYLHKLKILELCTMGMAEFPSGIVQLTNLHTLKLSHNPCMEIPLGFGTLTGLQNLEGKFNLNGDAMHGGLGEFKLMDLRGYLCISGIENITDVAYTREANLKSKSNLERLWLNFGDGYDEFYDNDDDNHNDNNQRDLHIVINEPVSIGDSPDMIDIQESMLDSLQPHGNIKDVKILNYGGTKWPSWISHPLQMSKLTYLRIDGSTCMCLPSLGRLPSLKFLDIRGFDVEKIGNEFCRELDSSSNNAFPSLEELVFCDMPKWEDWIGVLDCDFPCLEKLSITWCPNLRKLPTITNELEILDIYGCGFHEIQLPVSLYMKNVGISYCRNLTSVMGLNNYKSLTELTIDHCPLLKISIDYFLLSMITEVDIRYCAKLDIPGFENIDCYQKNSTEKRFNTDYFLVRFPESLFTLVFTIRASTNYSRVGMTSEKCVMLDLPILKELEIGKFSSSLASYYDNYCHNLKRLFILGLPKLCHFKENFMPVTVEYLEISHCHELITIPPLEENSALIEIRISECPKLSSIEGLHSLTSLKYLFLEDCPELRVLPCEKLQIRLERFRVYNCPLTVDWCKLNGFPENTEVRVLADGEQSRGGLET